MAGNNNLMALFVAVIGVVVFVSCETKPWQNPEEFPVVGKWSPVSWAYSEIVDGEIVFQNTGALDTNRTFQRDGTGWETRNFGEDGKDNWQTIYRFTWTFTDDKIFFTDVKFISPEGIAIGAPLWQFETEWSVIDLTASEMKVEYTQDPTEPDYNGYAHNIVIFEKVK